MKMFTAEEFCNVSFASPNASILYGWTAVVAFPCSHLAIMLRSARPKPAQNGEPFDSLARDSMVRPKGPDGLPAASRRFQCHFPPGNLFSGAFCCALVHVGALWCTLPCGNR